MEALIVLAVVVGAVILVAEWRRVRRETRAALDALTEAQRALEEKQAAMERWVSSLEQILAETAGQGASPATGSGRPPPPPVAPEARPSTLRQAQGPGRAELGGALAVPPAEAPSRVMVPPPPPIPPPPEMAPPPPPSAAPVVPPTQPLPTMAAESVPPPPPVVEPPPPFEPPPPPPPPGPSGLQRLATFLRGVDWEQFLGVKLFSIMAGVVALILGVLFIRYSIDHGWVIPPIRMAISIAFGLGLIVASETRWAREYRLLMQALCAAGIAVLFAAFFAAHALWHLIPALLAFLLLALVAATAVLLAIRRNSLVIAVLGLLGGFVTPILLSTGENRPLGLFGYLLLLNVGLAWVAHKQRWPILSALSLLFTLGYQGGWTVKFLDESQLPIAIGVFLVFPLVGFAGIALGSRRAREGQPVAPLARWSALTGALPPSLLALYVASSAEFAAQWPLVMAFAVVVAAGLAAVAAWQGPEWLHLAGGATVLAALAGFLARTFDGSQWPLLAAFLAAFVAVYLGAPLLLSRLGRDFRGQGRLGVLAAPLVLSAFIPVAHVAEATPLAFLLPLLVLAAACAGYAVLRGDGRVHLVAAIMAIAGEATWSAYHLAPGTLFPALVAFAAFAALFLGAPLLVERRGGTPAGAAAGLLRSAAPHLAVSAYLLLAYAAGQRELAVGSSAVAWLALLFLLDLGFLAAALVRRRPDLLASAAAGSVVVLLAHELGLGAEAPAPAIACGAAVATGAFFLVAYLAARRTGIAPARGLGAAGAAALLALHGGQLVLWTGASGNTWLPVAALVAAHAFLVLGLFALAWIAEVEEVALTAALMGAVAAPILLANDGSAPEVLWLATPPWLMAVAYPLIRGVRGRSDRLPLVGTVLASAVYLLVARKALLALGAGPYLGALPVLQALLLVPHLVMLLRMEPPSQRDLGRLAMVAASVLGLLTVAIPLQLDKQWWTIGWALLGAALAWLWTRIPHRGLLAWSGALLLASFVRLVPFPHAWIFDYHTRGQAPIWNWYLYTYALVAAAHFLAAWCFARTDDRLWPRMRDRVPVAEPRSAVGPPGGPRLSALAGAGGAVLMFLLVNIEIADFWTTGEARMDFRPFDGFGAATSYTVAWAVFGAGLLLAFRRWRHRLLLGSALVLLAASLVRLSPIDGTPQLAYHGELRILNWYLLAYGAVAGAFLLGAWLLRGTEDRLFARWPRTAPFLVGGAVLLLFALVNVEIADFFGEGAAVAVNLTEGYRPHLSYTVAWALAAVALVILFRRSPHPVTLIAATLLLLAALIRLRPFGSAPLFAYDRSGHVPILNGFLLAYVVVAIAMFAVARLLAMSAGRLARWVSILATVAGALVTFFLVNVEIADYWSTGNRITFRFSAGLAPDLTYTIAWAVFAIALLVAGIVFRSRNARLAAIGLLAVTLAKAFLHDLIHLTDLYQMASVLALLLSLVVVTILVKRFGGDDRAHQNVPPPADPTHPEAP
jgi:uncharacterized membrane protein